MALHRAQVVLPRISAATRYIYRSLTSGHCATDYPLLQNAWHAVSALPEIRYAQTSGAPGLAGAELARAHAILTQNRADAAHRAVCAHLVALNAHSRGLVAAELRARTAVLDALREAHTVLGAEQTPLLGMAASARAIASLRGSDTNLAIAAAEEARQTAACATSRLVAELCSVCAAPLSDPGRATRFSAIVALGTEGVVATPDIPGFARALRGGDSEELKALVVRWDKSIPASFEYVEALVATGRKLVSEASVGDGVDSDKQSAAEDFFARALAIAGEIGNELDKAEPLLGIAELYATQGKVIEAEGLFRSVEERFAKLVERDAFSVSAAGVYVRCMNGYSALLRKCEFNGNLRTREAEVVRGKGEKLREVFPEVLREDSIVPLWVVDSLLPTFELPLDTVAVDVAGESGAGEGRPAE